MLLQFYYKFCFRFGCTIISDGWTDTRRRHIVNILVSCCMGTMFLRSIDTSTPGLVLDGRKLFEYIGQAIEDVGKENVVQV